MALVDMQPEIRAVSWSELEPLALALEVRGVDPGPKVLAMIAKHEFFGAVILRRLNSGELVVVDGRRRLVAVLQANRLREQAGLPLIETVNAVIHPDGWINSVEVGLAANAARSANPPGELRMIEQWLRQNDYDPAAPTQEALTELGRATGMDVPTIKNRLRFRQLRPELRIAWERGKIRTSAAQALLACDDETQGRAVEILEREGGVQVKQVKHLKRVQQQAKADAMPDSLFEDFPETGTETNGKYAQRQRLGAIFGDFQATLTDDQRRALQPKIEAFWAEVEAILDTPDA